MCRPGISRLVLTLLLAGALAALGGCSTRENKILGNKRLIRGAGALGTTTRDVVIPDRDTYVSPGAANFGSVVLVGTSGAFEGRAFFRVPAWSLPDTNDASVVIQSIVFEAAYDTLVATPPSLILTLATTAAAYDTLAAWPGPAPDLALGGVDAGAVAPLRVSIPVSAYSLIRGWARDPASLPGLVLYPAGGSGLIGLQAGKATIKIRYDHTVSSATVTDSISTAIPLDFYLHPPLTPAATGSDPTLVLGGLYEMGLAIRFPAAAVTEGSTVNEATLRLRVDPGSPVFPTGRYVDLVLRRIKAPWSESVTDQNVLAADSTTLTAQTAVGVFGTADSVLSIPLPQSIIREWTSAAGINEGLLVTVKNGNLAPHFLIGARESSSPAELRVSITTPPPGKF